MDEYAERLRNLEKVVFEGNGRPSLLTRVEVMDQTLKELKDNSRSNKKLLFAIAAGVIAELVLRFVK